ncbi:BamA/TamA family outer membrane protein [Granulosicoccus antarcticus]|uniref:Outer membrane protein assembly factor BamA n=1 Tax=Granulosicoccus antarcticus IMCC3135 TaxID=1192854 RepID=A0A2Z2NVZ2_9GAMM|nr:BamA/TamA family outer membrane protein [Granulosicoccus antarcticus]ASJ75509.1 Outer membrane protein assembly factor BamA [Granulosicoccus antarcticus IMCC3135]
MSAGYTRFAALSLMLFASLSVSMGNAQAADAVPGEQWCDRPVDDIRFVGNKVTRAQVIERELMQKPGQYCSLDDIIDGMQNIMDLGLFKSIRAELDLAEGQLILSYLVVEKIFFLPLPRISRTSDGELRLGAQLRWDNFMGRLHQLKLTSEKRQEDDGRGRAGYVHSLEYNVPRFFGSRYGMSVDASVERRNAELSRDDEIYGETLRKSRRASLRLTRWANDSLGISGLSYFGGAGFEIRDYQMRSGVKGPFSDGENLALEAGFGIQRVHQEPYRRRGHYYGGSLAFADKVLGADFRYVRLEAEGRWYLALQKPQTNFNIRARLRWSDSAPFGERSYQIGGGELLRGMESGAHSGNILTLLNVEYLSGFFAYPAWRWLVFMDAGNVYLQSDVDLFRQHVRGGVGLRRKVEALTNADLRLDLAWDPVEGKVKPYLSTSLTF